VGLLTLFHEPRAAAGGPLLKGHEILNAEWFTTMKQVQVVIN
jgi:hypothetical protein